MKESQISLAFKIAKKENRPALLTYTVAGDNNKNTSLKILNAISNSSGLGTFTPPGIKYSSFLRGNLLKYFSFFIL